MTIDDEKLDELERCAEAASDTSPGCWVTDDGRQGRSELPNHVPYLPFVARVSVKGFHPVAEKLADDGRPEGCEFRETIETARSRAHHIAAADPPTVRALVEEVRRLRKAVEEVKGWAACNYEADGATADMVLGEIEETCRFALEDVDE